MVVTPGSSSGLGGGGNNPPLPPPGFARLSKGSNHISSEEGTMTTSLNQQPIWIFLVLSLLYSTERRNLWMLMLGFAPLSPSLHFFMSHAPRRTKLALQRSSSANQHIYGAIITVPCSKLAMLSSGKNSEMHSEATTFQRDLWTENSMNFWHLHRAIELLFSILKPSMT